MTVSIKINNIMNDFNTQDSTLLVNGEVFDPYSNGLNSIALLPTDNTNRFYKYKSLFTL